MPSDLQIAGETIRIHVELAGPEWSLRTTFSVPRQPIARKEILSLIFSFTDAVVGSAAKNSERSGESISCKKGCGACCRQLVPISETEAFWIRELVDALPPERQSEIRRRFAETRRRLAESGLLEKLLHPETLAEGEGAPLAVTYFRLGIPCPLLQDEACSIHPDRPIKCREYLVTSAAQHCRQPSADTIKMVDLPFRIWTAAARLDSKSPTDGKIPWVPLALALEWTDNHQPPPAPRHGREVLQEFFEFLSGKSADGAQSPIVEIPADSGARKRSES